MTIKATVPQIIRKLANDHKSYGFADNKRGVPWAVFYKDNILCWHPLKSEVATTTSHTRNDIYNISDSVQSLYFVSVDQKFKTLYSTGHAAVSFIFIDINFRG